MSLPKLLTYQFIHGSQKHLLYNMLFLGVFGGWLETRVGRWRYFVLYLAGGAAAGLFPAAVGELFGKKMGVYFIGASGAIAGMMGGCLIAAISGRGEAGIRLGIGRCRVQLKFKYLLLPALGYFLYNDLAAAAKDWDHGWVSAPWVHTGGWIFGVVALTFMQEPVMWSLSKVRLGAMKLTRFGSPVLTRDDLAAMLKSRPEDARVLVELARREMKFSQAETAERRYREAIFYLWRSGNKRRAARVFAEMFAGRRRIFMGAFQLELCELLLEDGQYEVAAGALEKVFLAAEARPEQFPAAMAAKASRTLVRVLGENLNRPASARYYERRLAGPAPAF